MKKVLFNLMVCFLAGCALGPDYKKPEITVPAEFRQATSADAELGNRWQPVDRLRTANDSRPWWERWWGLPADHELAQWLLQVEKANPNVELLTAQYRQADALLSAARAPWWPSLSTTVSSSRGQGVVGTTGGVTTGGAVRVTDKVSAATSWEVDLWGRISRGVESNEAALAASAADLKAAILSAQIAFAQAYFQWQANHGQQDLLNQTVSAYTRTLGITRSRYEAGVAPRTDVLQAETQLNTARAQYLDLSIQQGQLEHAMAVLVGKAPAEFSVPTTSDLPPLPNLPAILPAQLLLARPDVAAAERRVAAANAQIGVAQAVFFPTFSLGGSLGYQDNTFRDIISAPNRFWSFGPSVALTLFDGGARSAAKAQAEATHAQKTAVYRQTVLTAFQEVEDQLLTLRVLAAEEEVQAASVSGVSQGLQITEHQYKAGTVAYLNVTASQATALAAQRSLLDIKLRRSLAGLALVKAVGGQMSSGVNNTNQ
ncbi:MAG: hypothetical protein RIR18_575 [Pseudomonadota bacterium]|jgi:NodT family efflux transporter outer membrane factor (OMF) lipoprotein